MIDMLEYLQANPYPGRGVMLGRSADGKSAAIAYFIMGRSENSRNRVFEETEDGIRTRAFDESKMTDPSLIIYHPVRRMDNGLTIVTNGDQTDTIRDNILAGHCYRHALNTRTFEPDGPNYTPRISGVVKPDGSYALSILKSLDGDPACACRYFYEYDAPKAGTGHFIHTYESDGDPLPSFQGEPRMVSVTAPDAETLAGDLWLALNEDNKVSLFVRYIDLETGDDETSIINKHF
ncbi:MAG: inosine monophosphate cyclohydrolase [Oscillospiraceae bacterium]|nr:inosine monophosphate cyclohydrolase [Oscillospiraceae bacterium]